MFCSLTQHRRKILPNWFSHLDMLHVAMITDLMGGQADGKSWAESLQVEGQLRFQGIHFILFPRPLVWYYNKTFGDYQEPVELKCASAMQSRGMTFGVGGMLSCSLWPWAGNPLKEEIRVALVANCGVSEKAGNLEMWEQRIHPKFASTITPSGLPWKQPNLLS